MLINEIITFTLLGFLEKEMKERERQKGAKPAPRKKVNAMSTISDDSGSRNSRSSPNWAIRC